MRLRPWIVGLLVVLGGVVLLAAPVSAAVFPDVDAYHPYRVAIEDLAARDVIGGYTNGNFGPEDSVMRQQFAKMVVKTLSLPVAGTEVCPFPDVVVQTGIDPFYPSKYVAVCAAYNITKGKDATHFDPYANITRLQVTTMIVRAAENLLPGTLQDPPAGWSGQLAYNDPTHGANLRKAEYNGLLGGLQGLSASWDGYARASRGECAQVLYNLILLFPPGHFESLGGELTSGPGACVHGDGDWFVVFARGLGDALWYLEEDGQGGWGNWDEIGDISTSDPATTNWGPTWGGVFWRGIDNAIWYRWWDNAWLAPHSLGGTFTSGPAATIISANRVDVFARGTDNALWHNRGSGPIGNWAWSGWESLGGVLTSGPTAVSWGPNRIDVFARGTDNGLVHTWWNGIAWSQWENLGGILCSGPGASSWGSGRLDVFARGPGSSLWRKTYSGGAWSAWENLGGVIISDPEAVAWKLNRIDVFARGADNDLLHTWWDGSAWRP